MDSQSYKNGRYWFDTSISKKKRSVEFEDNWKYKESLIFHFQ